MFTALAGCCSIGVAGILVVAGIGVIGVSFSLLPLLASGWRGCSSSLLLQLVALTWWYSFLLLLLLVSVSFKFSLLVLLVPGVSVAGIFVVPVVAVVVTAAGASDILAGAGVVGVLIVVVIWPSLLAAVAGHRCWGNCHGRHWCVWHCHRWHCCYYCCTCWRHSWLAVPSLL